MGLPGFDLELDLQTQPRWRQTAFDRRPKSTRHGPARPGALREDLPMRRLLFSFSCHPASLTTFTLMVRISQWPDCHRKTLTRVSNIIDNSVHYERRPFRQSPHRHSCPGTP